MNPLWVLPAGASVAAGALLVFSLALRFSNEGPDAVDVHDALGKGNAVPLDAARLMLELLVVARRENERTTDVKLRFIRLGFIAFSAAMLVSVPVALIRAG